LVSQNCLNFTYICRPQVWSGDMLMGLKWLVEGRFAPPCQVFVLHHGHGGRWAEWYAIWYCTHLTSTLGGPAQDLSNFQMAPIPILSVLTCSTS
jgi:hypothetical protein